MVRSNVSTLPICGEQLRAAHGCAVTEQAVHISDSSGIYPLLISSSSFLPSILFGSVRRDHDADSCCVSTLYILKFSKNFAPFDHLPLLSHWRPAAFFLYLSLYSLYSSFSFLATYYFIFPPWRHGFSTNQCCAVVFATAICHFVCFSYFPFHFIFIHSYLFSCLMHVHSHG